MVSGQLTKNVGEWEVLGIQHSCLGLSSARDSDIPPLGYNSPLACSTYDSA